MNMLTKLLAVSATAVAALAIEESKSNQGKVCNGYRDLCLRRYNEMSFVGAHDSPFIGEMASDNQNLPMIEQFAMGVRFVQAQTHDKNGAIQLCHSSCDLRDAGPIDEFLKPVMEFMEANRHEIITLLITNPDGIQASEYDAAFRRVGLHKHAYVPGGSLDPGPGHKWPLLQDMIWAQQRLVVFMGSSTTCMEWRLPFMQITPAG